MIRFVLIKCKERGLRLAYSYSFSRVRPNEALSQDSPLEYQLGCHLRLKQKCSSSRRRQHSDLEFLRNIIEFLPCANFIMILDLVTVFLYFRCSFPPA